MNKEIAVRGYLNVRVFTAGPVTTFEFAEYEGAELRTILLYAKEARALARALKKAAREAKAYSERLGL